VLTGKPIRIGASARTVTIAGCPLQTTTNDNCPFDDDDEQRIEDDWSVEAFEPISTEEED